MSAPVNLTIVQGEPIAVTATVTGGAARWPTGNKAYGEIRLEANGSLVKSLNSSLSTATVGADVVLTLSLTGSATRAIPVGGYYDVFISEATGTAEAYGLRVLHGVVTVVEAVTRKAP